MILNSNMDELVSEIDENHEKESLYMIHMTYQSYLLYILENVQTSKNVIQIRRITDI